MSIVVTDKGIYEVDVESMRAKLFDMPMTTSAPEIKPIDDILLRMRMDAAPRIHAPFLITSVCDDKLPAWEFAYLFPLNRRWYKRTRQ